MQNITAEEVQLLVDNLSSEQRSEALRQLVSMLEPGVSVPALRAITRRLHGRS